MYAPTSSHSICICGVQLTPSAPPFFSGGGTRSVTSILDMARNGDNNGVKKQIAQGGNINIQDEVPLEQFCSNHYRIVM